MARTYRKNNRTLFDDEQRDIKGNRHKHNNNRVTGGIPPAKYTDDLEYEPDELYNQYGVRIRNVD